MQTFSCELFGRFTKRELIASRILSCSSPQLSPPFRFLANLGAPHVSLFGKPQWVYLRVIVPRNSGVIEKQALSGGTRCEACIKKVKKRRREKTNWSERPERVLDVSHPQSWLFSKQQRQQQLGQCLLWARCAFVRTDSAQPACVKALKC